MAKAMILISIYFTQIRETYQKEITKACEWVGLNELFNEEIFVRNPS